MENEQYIESGLSVGAVKYVDPNEIITEEEYNYIKNKVPELNGRVGVIEDEIDEINSSLDNIVQNKYDYVNIREFNAKGNGIEVDTSALRNALISGKNICCNKNEIYLIDEVLNLTNVNNVIIDGCGATIKFKNGVSSSQISETGIINISGNNLIFKNFNIDINGQWIVRPFTWESTYQAYLDLRVNHYTGLKFIDCNNLNVQNINIKNGLNGIILRNTTNFTVEKINVYKMMADGIFVTDGCSFGNIRNCYCEECNDDTYSCNGYTNNAVIQPHNIVFDNCNSHNCVGALVCMEGCYNVKFINSTGTEIKHKPFKTGLMRPYAENPILAYGSYQTIENCKFSLAETVQGDSNGSDESVVCSIQSGDNITLRNIQIIKPSVSKRYEIQLQGTNYLIENVKMTNIGLSLSKMHNVKILNCNLKLNDSLFIIQGTSINILDTNIHNQSLVKVRGEEPIIYSGQNNCLLKRSNLTSDGEFTHQIKLIGNAPTYKNFKTDLQSVTCDGGFEGLLIDGVYLAGILSDARFGDGQLVNDQYGFGIIKNKTRIKLQLQT